MRIDIQADLTPELLTEAGIAYSTKDKVYGAKYLKKRNGQIGRGAFICALGVAMIVMFFVTKRAEFLVLAPVAFLIGGTSLYAATVGNEKMLTKKLAQAGGETRHRRYLITDKSLSAKTRPYCFAGRTLTAGWRRKTASSCWARACWCCPRLPLTSSSCIC